MPMRMMGAMLPLFVVGVFVHHRHERGPVDDLLLLFPVLSRPPRDRSPADDHFRALLLFREDLERDRGAPLRELELRKVREHDPVFSFHLLLSCHVFPSGGWRDSSRLRRTM